MGMPAVQTTTIPAPRTGLMRQKVVTITANKGGVGKTTLAFSLAIGARIAGYSVAIVDLDAQHGCEFLRQIRLRKLPKNEHVDVYPEDISNAAEVMDRIEGAYDIVFVDTPPGVEKNEVPVRYIVNRSDFVLVPTCSGILDLRACVDWLSSLRPVKGNNIAFVMNRAKSRASATDYMREIVFGKGRVCDAMIRDLQVIADDQKIGQTAFDRCNRNLNLLSPRQAEKIRSETMDLRMVWNYLCQELDLR